MPIDPDGFVMFTCSDVVNKADFISIDFSAADFSLPPIITATVDGDVNVFVSDITKSTAVLNFSSKFEGRVTYIIRSKTT